MSPDYHLAHNVLRLNTLGGLWLESAGGADGPVPRPRWLALLAVLAAARDAGASRDRLLGVLWPDRDEARARHALSQTLYSLKRVLGIEVVVAEPAIRLDPERVRSDLDDFRDAIQRGEWDRAIDLYRGPFLDGFYLQDAPAFDQWVETERQTIRTQAIRALDAGLARAVTSGDRRRATDLAARLTVIDPLSGRFALRYMETLAGLGDRAGALAHARTHAEAVRETLGVEPDEAVVALAAKLRAEAPAAGPGPDRPDQPSGSAATPPGAGRRATLTGRWAIAVIVVVAVAVGLWLGFGRRDRPGQGTGLVIAVGLIRDVPNPDSAQVSQILADMLTTSLSRLANVEVVATSRLLELLPAGPSVGADARARAARQAGATEVLEGDVSTRAGGGLQLDVRRVDLGSGMVVRGYRVSGATRFDLVDSATTLIAADLRSTAPAVSVAEITTRSPLAYRFYEEGLRSFYQYDLFAAGRLFQSALREDSSFALAAYYAWRSAAAAADTGTGRLAERALRLSSRASARDRLIIQAHLAAVRDDPAGYLAADSLAASFPNDPEALVRAADVFWRAGEPIARVATLLERAVALDSGAAAGEPCRACGDLAALATAYREADSFPAADAVLRRWVRLRPADPAPWLRLADLADDDGNVARADSAHAAARAAGAPPADTTARAVRLAAHRAEVGGVERRCRLDAEAPLTAAMRVECTRGYRALGRLAEALRFARAGVGARGGESGIGDTVTTIMLDYEALRVRLAAETFGRLADRARQNTAGGEGAARAAGYLTLAAIAQDARDDSLRVAPLVRAVASLEQRSLTGRPGRLARLVQALLLRESRRSREAFVLLEEARGSRVTTFPRFDRELGRIAIDAGRPAEALRPLRAALRAPPDGWGGSVNPGDLHDLLAHAFAALGQNDSARAHYAWVARAWRDADAPLRARADSANRWLEGDDRRSPR